MKWKNLPSVYYKDTVTEVVTVCNDVVRVIPMCCHSSHMILHCVISLT